MTPQRLHREESGMTTEADPAPLTRGQISARLSEIAPQPDDARSLAKCIAVAALRRWHRHLTPHQFADDENSRALERESVNGMCYEFAALHLLMAMLAGEPGESPDFTVAQITDAWDDGGGIGEWLWEHAQALGIDAGEVNRLEDAWQALPESRQAGTR